MPVKKCLLIFLVLAAVLLCGCSSKTELTITPYAPQILDFEQITIEGSEAAEIRKFLRLLEYSEEWMTDETAVIKLSFSSGEEYFVKADLDTCDIHGICVSGSERWEEHPCGEAELPGTLKSLLVNVISNAVYGYLHN